MSSRGGDITVRVVLPPEPVQPPEPVDVAALRTPGEHALWAALSAVLRELRVRGGLLRPGDGVQGQQLRPPPLDWHPRWPRFAGE
jgi:hypothetical protein